MCGICGATHDPEGRAIAAMCGLMVHRGPDDEGRYIDERSGAALGARRLSIIDPSGGHQPVANEDGSVWAVLNGEVYNHPALQKRLVERGHRLSSRTDTEVLVHLYEEYGDAMVHALEGMYAFAIWDAARRQLLLVRDRFGEKPLFFREHAGRLEFASELTALGAGVAEPLALDPGSIDDYFVLGYVPGEASVARGVRQLLPGHTLTWSAGDPVARPRRYWAAPERPVRGDRSSGELIDELDSLLRVAVRSRLIADVPVGVFLSGGLDSTLVTALAAEQHSGRLRSFTVSYDVGSVNEDREARAVARRLGTEHSEIVLEEADVERRVLSLFGSIDQPNADPALVALHAVAELARPHVTVALGGEGADELFGGYPRYRWLERAAALDRHVPGSVRAPVAQVIRRQARSAATRRIADVVGPGDLAGRHLDWVTERRRHIRGELYGPRLRAVASGRAVDDVRGIIGTPTGARTAASFMDLDQRRWLPDNVLCKADRASMMNSLEMRTPFLDRSVAEFAASIPAAIHMAHGGKSVLKGVLERVTREDPFIPSKTAFRVPQSDWLRGPLSGVLAHHTTDGRLVTDGWFDGAAMQRVVREHAAGRDHSAVLWPALALGIWLEGAGRAFAAP
jgi:asparagine synthase (glutamine-hydrolysing)